MGYSKVVAALAILALASGCAGVTSKITRALRSPGERIKTFPEEVWAEYRCSQRKLPFFKIETLELHPKKLTPGQKFNHRFVYSLCPTTPTAVITGMLETSILFKGKALIREADGAYDLKPGRWVIDTFVTLPPQAKPGLYGLQLKFRGKRVKFQRTLSFTVRAVSGT